MAFIWTSGLNYAGPPRGVIYLDNHGWRSVGPPRARRTAHDLPAAPALPRLADRPNWTCVLGVIEAACSSGDDALLTPGGH